MRSEPQAVAEVEGADSEDERVAAGTCKAQLHRARQLLRTLLNERAS